jgi:hypothetical protein
VQQGAPARARQSYRHEAFLWDHSRQFTEAMVSFVEDGLARDEPVMTVLVQEHTEWLRAALGKQAREVTFLDMGDIGRNPARIIPTWQAWLDQHEGRHRPTRGIGEPIWAGRRPTEIEECQLHEALLNVAFDPETPFWLICPYDSGRLAPSVIAQAHRTHHALFDTAGYRGSTAYEGGALVSALFTADLPPLLLDDAGSGAHVESRFTDHNAQDVFALVTQQAYAAELWSDRAIDLARAVRRLVRSALARGAGQVVVRLWNQPDGLVCELVDRTVIDDVLVGRRAPLGDEDDALWSANQTCDLVQLRSGAAGTTVRITAYR